MDTEQIPVTTGPSGSRRKVIIDTDVGIDDAQAIFLLLMDPLVEVIAIMCVGGNTTLENVCVNTLKVLTVAGRLDIPVFRGCKAPIIGNVKYGTPYHGDDGLGDCDPAVLSVTVDPSVIQQEHATSAIIRLASLYPGEVSIICIAPLTNLAIAIKIEPDFTKLLKAVYVMGGNHSAEGNETATAEFNFHHDPEAASIVLSNTECEVVLMGWEVCSQLSSRFDSAWRKEFYSQPTPHGQFLRLISQRVLAIADANETTADSGMIMCDEWVAALFLDADMAIQSKVWPTAVELSGSLTRGQCVVDKRFYHEKAQGKNNVRHVLEVDTERMKRRLMAMMQAQIFPSPM